MRVIEIDGSSWRKAWEFCDALCLAIKAPQGHGSSPDAFTDSMIWGGMNGLEAPYVVRIVGTERAPKEVSDYIELVRTALVEGREDRRSSGRGDMELSLEVFTGH